MARPQIRNPIGRVILGVRSHFRWSRGAVGLAARLTRIETTGKVPTALRLLTRDDSEPLRTKLGLDLSELEEVLDGNRTVESAVERAIGRLTERGVRPRPRKSERDADQVAAVLGPSTEARGSGIP